jgi:MFS family permease
VLADTIGFAWTFVVAGLVSGIGLIPALLSRRQPLPPLDGHERPARPAPLFAALRRHLRKLLVGGVVPMLVMTAREGRYVVLPLIGDELGLGATAVGAVVAVGTAADLLLFPVSGWIMDRYGRLAAMVPAFGLIAVGLLMLGFAESTTAVVLAGTVMGIGNGMSAGTMLTLGSDLAPADATSEFLAGMAVMQDVGRITGPLLVGVVGAALGLGAASIALAVVLVAAIAWMVLVIGETGRAPNTAVEPA